MAAHSRAETPPASSAADTDPAREAELPDGFERLYAEHFEFVWRTLRRLGVRGEHLDDAAQDVFIVFLRRRREFRGHSSQRTWLFGIANNVSHQYRRKQQRDARATPINEQQRAEHPSPLEQEATSEELRLIDSFLGSLDDDKRNVFILAELEQMSAPEIASALQIKPNTVYSRLRLARQAFHALLSQHPRKP